MVLTWFEYAHKNCSIGIRNAWHFQHALVLVFKVVYGDFSITLLPP
ncbi:DUF3265 domain-containing protein [Plesiomonas shigelloides]|nr:DUF3265 domain-containing protein [Plesiomonas shigelloides]